MKPFLTFALCLLAIAVHAATPSTKSFRGAGGILVTSNDTTAIIIIDGSSISSPTGGVSAAVATNIAQYYVTNSTGKPASPLSSVQFNSNGVMQGSAAFLYTNGAVIATNFWDSRNVKYWGAKGDGITDDTAAFVAAQAFTNKLIIPSGDYLISALVIVNNTIMEGIGKPSLIRTGFAAIMIDCSGASNVTLRGFRLDGNGRASFFANNVPGTNTGISMRAEFNNRIQDMDIYGFTSNGVSILGTSGGYINTSAHLSGLTVRDCFSGIYVQGEYLYADDCSATTCWMGFNTTAGNTFYTGCSATKCGIGLEVAGTINTGHGSWIGGTLNHSGYAAEMMNLQLGFEMLGVNIFGSTIKLTGCSNVVVEGLFGADCFIEATGVGTNFIRGVGIGNSPVWSGTPLTNVVIDTYTLNQPNAGHFVSEVAIGLTNRFGMLNIRGTQAGFDTYFGHQYGNTINFNQDVNSLATGYINFRGYQDGTTVFRDLTIANGKGDAVLQVDGTLGRVGIGTTVPSSSLDVTGQVRAASAIFTNTIDVGGTITANQLNAGIIKASGSAGLANVYATNFIYAPTNTGPVAVTTNLFAAGTRYTNDNRRSFVTASIQLSAAAAGTAKMTLYVENAGSATNRASVSAGPLASLITVEQLMLPVGPSMIYYFTDETSGVGATASIVANTCSIIGF